MKNLKRVLSLVLALMMALSLMAFSSSASAAGSTSFTVASQLKGYDNVAEENQEAVDVVVALDVIRGDTGDGTGEPDINANGNLKRAEAAVILARLVLGVEVTDGLPEVPTAYSDITADYLYATGAIQTCTRMELIAGNGDGTFEPAGTLTYAAFGKMLLGALGYNSEIEGYANVGELWVSNVAMGLTRAGINLAGVGLEDTLTRQQAMQMVFKALQARTVTYEANSKVFKYVETDKDSGKIAADGYVQLAEEKFPKLALTPGEKDAFGRPVSVWQLNGEAICQDDNAFTAVATYTTEISGGANAQRNLGLTGYSLKDNNVTPVVDGTDDDVITSFAGLAGLTGAGVTVSVYATDSVNPTTITDIVVVNNYFGRVNRVSAGNNGTTVTVSKLAGPGTRTSANTYTSGDFNVGDYVLYTVGKDGIASMTLADSVSGTITATATGYLRLDGEKYNLADGYTGSIELGDAVIYLDNFNNVIYIGEVESVAPGYLYVQNADKYMGSWSIKAVFADGTTEIVNVSSKTASSVVDISTDDKHAFEGKVFRYEMDGDAYRLTGKSESTITNAAINNGSTKIDGTGGSITVNSSTVFVDVQNGMSYTGYANVPSYSSATVYYALNTGVADVVFITSGTPADTGTENVFYFYVANVSNNVEKFRENGSDYYRHPVYVDGVSQTIVVSEDVHGTLANGKLYRAMTANNSGYTTAVSGPITLDATVATYAEKGTLNLQDGTSVGYNNNDTVFVLVDGSKVSVGSASDIVANATVGHSGTYVTVVATVQNRGVTASLVYIVTTDDVQVSAKDPGSLGGDQENEAGNVSAGGLETDIEHVKPEAGDSTDETIGEETVTLTPVSITIPAASYVTEGKVLDSVTVKATGGNGVTLYSDKSGTELTNGAVPTANVVLNEDKTAWVATVYAAGYTGKDTDVVWQITANYTDAPEAPGDTDEDRYGDETVKGSASQSDIFTVEWDRDDPTKGTLTVLWNNIEHLTESITATDLEGKADTGDNSSVNILQLLRGVNAPGYLWASVGLSAPVDSDGDAAVRYTKQFNTTGTAYTVEDFKDASFDNVITVGSLTGCYQYVNIANVGTKDQSGNYTQATNATTGNTVWQTNKADTPITITVCWEFSSGVRTVQTFTVTRTYDTTTAANENLTLSTQS